MTKMKLLLLAILTVLAILAIIDMPDNIANIGFLRNELHQKENLEPDFLIPVVLDSLELTDRTYNTSEMQEPINNIIYIGTVSDTINRSKLYRFNYDNYLSFEDYEESSKVKTGLKLYISNKQLLTIDLEDFSISPPPIQLVDNEDFEIDSVASAKTIIEWNKRPINYIQALPVFIYNPSRDTVYLEQQDGRVIMIQEAKDENGVWKPIELWRYSWCGNSYGAEGLLPNTMAIVKVFVYNGDFETEIRLKLKNGKNIIYSDSYKGTINKSQFELPAEIKENYVARKEAKAYLDRIFLNN